MEFKELVLIKDLMERIAEFKNYKFSINAKKNEIEIRYPDFLHSIRYTLLNKKYYADEYISTPFQAVEFISRQLRKYNLSPIY